MKVSLGVVSYGTDEGVGVGRASVEKVSSQMVNEVADMIQWRKYVELMILNSTTCL